MAAYEAKGVIETLKNDRQKRLFSYAVDMGTRITTQFDRSDQCVREIQRAPWRAKRLAWAAGEPKNYTIRKCRSEAKTLDHRASRRGRIISSWKRQTQPRLTASAP